MKTQHQSRVGNRNGLKLWAEAKRIIPGGTQLFGKRAELFLPKQWPTYYKRAEGVEVWDLDGKRYVDMSYMGIGSCVLGYADTDINKAVINAIHNGSMSTLNCPEDVALAKVLLELHPWAEMVRYARTGGEAMTIAIRLARAHSGKDRVAFCGYHGWHDWYLATNLADRENLDGQLIPGLEPKGVPRALVSTALPFHYNRIEELSRIVAEHKDIGVIVIEPSRHQPPAKGFFREVRRIANRIGAVLVFDEITIGWKLNVGGVHLLHKINPDIVIFAKAMANGFPMAAILGKRPIMERAQETFVSSTFWTERIGPVAALATIKKMKQRNVPAHLKSIGAMIQAGWRKAAARHHLNIRVGGPEALSEFYFEYGDQNQAIRTLYTQEMLKLGFLDMACVYVSFAHKKSHITAYLQAVDAVFAHLADAIKKGRVLKELEGPIAQNRFSRIS
jgi:glutamate-1-semialdehyde aminotransferase